MEDHNVTGQSLVCEVGIKRRQVSRHHQTFVTDDLARHGRDVEIWIACQLQCGRAITHEQRRIKRLAVQPIGLDKDLLETGQLVQCNRAQAIVVGRNDTPSSNRTTAIGQLTLNGGTSFFG